MPSLYLPDGRIINLLGLTAAGAQDKAHSLPVTLATDQPAVPVSGTFFPDTQPVSLASSPLPANAATEATLAGMRAQLPAALGQAVDAASLPVVLPADQDPREDLVLLRRLVKLTESLATVDVQQRQRVTVDAFVPAIATVSSVTSVTGLAGVDARYLFMDTARTAYATGIRANLITS